MTRLVFGGLVALILLGLYTYATIYSIIAAQCLSAGPCPRYTKDLNEGIVTVLNLVGGLVSALVIAQLAVTDPGGAPGGGLVDSETLAETSKKVLNVLSVGYILVWLACGLASVIVGFLQYPDVVPQLTSNAKSWMGLAVAAGYSYLGVRRAGG